MVVSFEAIVAKRGDGHVVELPSSVDPVSTFGKVRAPVVVTINKHSFRTTLMRYSGIDYIGLNSGVRTAAALVDGAIVTVSVALDEEPRVVQMPAELAAALIGEDELQDFYESLSFSHQREYAEWIGSAKKSETRSARGPDAARPGPAPVERQ